MMEESIRSELILELDENGMPVLNKRFDELIHKEELLQSDVVVISTVGQAKGKTLLTDILKHDVIHNIMQAAEQRSENDWWLDEQARLTECDYNPLGSERETPGIRLYVTQLPSNTSSNEKKSTMIFLDSQGTAEDKNANLLFALMSAVSSTLIYNVSQTISLHDLKQLEKFTEVAQELRTNFDIGAKPFQKLLFLVRDWYRLPEADLGSIGGQAVIDEKLRDDGEENSEKHYLLNHIQACFSKDDIGCFLMPHPGLEVTSQEFDGDFSDMNADFKRELKPLISFVLDPENLSYKMTRGERINVGRWATDLKNFVQQIEFSFVLPDPRPINTNEIKTDIFLSTLEAENKMVRQQIIVLFNTPLDDDQLKEEFTRLQRQTVDEFRNKCGLDQDADDIQLQKYTRKLSEDIQEYYEFGRLQRKNEQKNMPSTSKKVTETKKKKTIVPPSTLMDFHFNMLAGHHSHIRHSYW